MLAVVRNMVLTQAIAWPDESDATNPLHRLLEYAALDANGEPSGRLPMLKRIGRHFGVPEAAAKDVIKVLVLRVLNGGSVEAWCVDMGIVCPAEQQADLRDLADVARIVRAAFFSMLEEQSGAGALQALKERVAAHMHDKHVREVQHAQTVGAPLPQPPPAAAHCRTMFSYCIFELEDKVLDCIDRELQSLGWTVASLIFDGVRPSHCNRHAALPSLSRAF